MSNILEVAEKAGVSPTTVSHVINNTRFVSEATRARVLAAMDELGYRPNALARSLRRGQTHTLGLILPDSANPFFAEVGRMIEDTAFERGYSVVLCNTEGDFNKEHLYIDVLGKKQVDGLIFVASGEQTDSLRALLRRKLPVVIVDRDVPGNEVDAVLTDNRQGGHLATRHLISLGHRRIGCIAGPSHLTPSEQRVIGYRSALEEAGIAIDDSLIMRGDFHPESGRVATRDFLRRPDPPTAVFACNDLMALGALRAAAEANRRVPADLAVVGFDDIELASYTIPPLTTIAQPKADMGRLAVHILIERMGDKARAPRRELLPTRLVVRGSCGGQA
ncbi:MAG TPA: LacI family DNA-binding transcriptional regulator [Anaerolineae bacterium]|nr:LacI family DNA-binding transcriptional regulator [Anaerolineae bacterium]